MLNVVASVCYYTVSGMQCVLLCHAFQCVLLYKVRWSAHVNMLSVGQHVLLHCVRRPACVTMLCEVASLCYSTPSAYQHMLLYYISLSVCVTILYQVTSVCYYAISWSVCVTVLCQVASIYYYIMSASVHTSFLISQHFILNFCVIRIISLPRDCHEN